MDSSASNQKISWFRKESAAGNLDLNPNFQRRPVWTEEQSSYLIDTILNGLPIPEIYIRSSSTPAGETSYEVVDGQQRVRSVLLFGARTTSSCRETT
jgi:ParB-like chromosome segregation protein Spo0J